MLSGFFADFFSDLALSIWSINSRDNCFTSIRLGLMVFDAVLGQLIARDFHKLVKDKL